MSGIAVDDMTERIKNVGRQPTTKTTSPHELGEALRRYRAGESRSTIFRDLVLGSIRVFPKEAVTVLDIGCGHGFDGDANIQTAIAAEARQYLGLEPDETIPPPPYFAKLHRCTLENSSLKCESVHVAYSTFVLEHVQDPRRFWQQVHHSLHSGGIFWGFTVDARHPFSFASLALDRLKLKEVYLNALCGKRGTERYENYPTFYRANTPRQIKRHTRQFRAVEFLTVHREGQLDYYFPRPLRRLVHLSERVAMNLHLPGSILVVKLTK